MCFSIVNDAATNRWACCYPLFFWAQSDTTWPAIRYTTIVTNEMDTSFKTLDTPTESFYWFFKQKSKKLQNFQFIPTLIGFALSLKILMHKLSDVIFEDNERQEISAHGEGWIDFNITEKQVLQTLKREHQIGEQRFKSLESITLFFINIRT